MHAGWQVRKRVATAGYIDGPIPYSQITPEQCDHPSVSIRTLAANR